MNVKASRRDRRTRRPDIRTVIKDSILFALGVGLILWEAVGVARQEFNLSVMLMGAALVGTPGVEHAWGMLTAGRSSPDQQEESPSPPPSSPSVSQVDDEPGRA